MPMSQAARLCRDLIVVPPNFTAYRAASQQVMQRLGVSDVAGLVRHAIHLGMIDARP